MDKETYEALKIIIKNIESSKDYIEGLENDELYKNVYKVEDWINEVAKEYEVYDNENENWKKILRN